MSQSLETSNTAASTTRPVDLGERKQAPWADLACIGLLAVVCAAMFFLGLGSVGIIDPGDGYYSEGAREMIESGDYVTPRLNYQMYCAKPILIYWLIASAYHVFGVNEFAARFWSALLATGLVVAIYWLGRCMFNRKTGLLAGLILASSPLVVTFARLSVVVLPMTCFIGLALVALSMTVVAGSRRWWPVLYVALGLSVLTKGPVGVGLITASFALFLLVRRPSAELLKQWLRRLHLTWGSLILAAIVVPWHIAVAQATDWLFLKVFYLYENLGRFNGEVNHEHSEVWYYLPILVYGFAPWVIFLPSAIANVWRSRRSSGHIGRAGVDALLLLTCFAATVITVFSISAAKLQTYILPAFPALAVLVAVLFERWTRHAERTPRWLKISSGVLAMVALGAAIAVPILAIFVKGIAWPEKLVGGMIGALVAVGWALVLLFFRRGRIAFPLYASVATTVVGCALISYVAFQVGYQYRGASLHELIRPLIGRQVNVAFYREFKPSVMFYLRQPVDTFFIPQQLVPANSWLANTAGVTTTSGALYILAGKDDLRSLAAGQEGRFRLLDRKGSWCLLETDSLSLRKLATLEETFKQDLRLDMGGHNWGSVPFAGGPRRISQR